MSQDIRVHCVVEDAVLRDPARLSRLRAELTALGMHTIADDRLRLLGILSGTIERNQLGALRGHPSLTAVQEDATYTAS